MRILAVSNYYPPHYIGGYELGCRDVVEALKQRGHEVNILTSTHGVTCPEVNKDVYRLLSLTPSTPEGNLKAKIQSLFAVERNNLNVFRHLCQEIQPDLVYFWNMAHLSLSLAFDAQRASLPVCFYVSEHWLSQWEVDNWYALISQRSPHPMKQWIRDIGRNTVGVLGLETFRKPLRLEHVQFCSQFLKDGALRAGKPVENACVIHWGIDPNLFSFQENSMPERLLFVGRVVREKGVHTAVHAMTQIVSAYPNVTLTIAGSLVDEDYTAELREYIKANNLEGQISILGSLPREQVKQLYAEHGTLLFPSLWDEPFGITPLEAMSSGLAVIGTTTGGSAEIFQHEINALTFLKGDDVACADQVCRLLASPDLHKNLRVAGRRTIIERFTFNSMIDHIESELEEIL